MCQSIIWSTRQRLVTMNLAIIDNKHGVYYMQGLILLVIYGGDMLHSELCVVICCDFVLKISPTHKRNLYKKKKKKNSNK